MIHKKPRVAAFTCSLMLAACGVPDAPVASDAGPPASISPGATWAHGHPQPRASRSHTRSKHPTPRRPSPKPSGVSRGGVNWDAIAGCESGGHWNHHTSLNGYWGGLQMGPPFWRDWGGLAYAARPDLATKAQQITVAVRAYAKRGLSPWPYCRRFA